MASKVKKESSSEVDDTSEYESGSSVDSSPDSSSSSSSEKKKKPKRKSSSKKKKKPKKKRRSSNKKKKGEPTRPRTAYTYFMKERRQEIADKNPIASFGEIAKMLGKYWKEEISTQEKEKYLKLAEEDKERYNREKEEWSAKEHSSSSSSSSSEKKKKTKKKKKKDPNAPKRPVNSFLLYSRQVRPKVKEDPQYKDLDNTSIGKKVGEMWKALSVEEKKPFVDEAELDKERYNREMKEYNTKNGKE